MDNFLQTLTIPNTTVILSGRGIIENQPPSVHVTVKATVEIDAKAAQRRATIWLASEVGNMLLSDTPQLIIELQDRHQPIWRVPVYLTSSMAGTLGQVGSIDVDGVSGQLLETEATKQTILSRVNHVSHSA